MADLRIKPIDWDILDDLIDQGMNCKQLAKHYGISYEHFVKKAKKKLGIYLSIYILKRIKKL